MRIVLEQKRPYTGSGNKQVILQHYIHVPQKELYKDVIFTLGFLHAKSDLALSDYYLFRSFRILNVYLSLHK